MCLCSLRFNRRWGCLHARIQISGETFGIAKRKILNNFSVRYWSITMSALHSEFIPHEVVKSRAHYPLGLFFEFSNFSSARSLL
jgi:hypothetical protein